MFFLELGADVPKYDSFKFISLMKPSAERFSKIHSRRFGKFVVGIIPKLVADTLGNTSRQIGLGLLKKVCRLSKTDYDLEM